MLRISKEEAMYLNSQGIVFGENGISHTYGKHHHYFLTESQKNLKMLGNYRNSRKVS